MSARVKPAGIKGLGIITAILFVVLMQFNDSTGNIDLLGLKLSASVPSAVAEGERICADVCYWHYYWRDCPWLGDDCVGCWIDGQWPPHCSKY